MILFECTGIVRKYDVILFIFYAIYLIRSYLILFSILFRLVLKPLWCDLTRQMTCFKLGKLRMKCLKKTYWSFLGPSSKARDQKIIGYLPLNADATIFIEVGLKSISPALLLISLSRAS